MLYISPENEYPRHIGDIKIQNPSWKEGEPLPTGWVEVKELSIPEISENEIWYEEFPVEVGGVMTQNFKVRAMTAEEIERRDAPKTARQKLKDLGLTEVEIDALLKGLV